jgi:hypothetical protein
VHYTMHAESSSSVLSFRMRVGSASEHCYSGRAKLSDISLRQGSAWYCDAPAAYLHMGRLRHELLWYEILKLDKRRNKEGI